MGRTPWKRHFLFAVLYILGANSKSCPHPPVLFIQSQATWWSRGGGLHLASFVFLCSLLRKRKEYLQPSATATLNHLLEKAGTKHHAKEMVYPLQRGGRGERERKPWWEVEMLPLVGRRSVSTSSTSWFLFPGRLGNWVKESPTID